MTPPTPMPPLPEWLGLLSEAQLSLREQAILERELRIFDQAVSAKDGAKLSASIEILTSLLVAPSTLVLRAELLKTFVEESQDHLRRAFGWLNLAATHVDLAQYPEATFALDNAKATFVPANHSEGLASVLLSRANIHRVHAEGSEARVAYQEALAGTKSKTKKLRVLENWLGLELDEGRLGPARSLGEEWLSVAALDDFRSERLPAMLHDYGLIGRRFLLSGDRDSATSIAARCSEVAARASLDVWVVCAELIAELDELK